MVLFLLEIKAELENVESIKVPRGATFTITVTNSSGEDTQENVTVKNSSGEDTRENVTVSSTEDVDLAGSRGTAHFAMKWARDARNQANLNVIEDIKGTALQYTVDDGHDYAPIVGFECRGLEPVGFQPTDIFTVEAASGTRFDDVDLSDDWADFDEKAGDSVSVMNLEWRFKVRR